jgi:hypothetical protein
MSINTIIEDTSSSPLTAPPPLKEPDISDEGQISSDATDLLLRVLLMVDNKA